MGLEEYRRFLSAIESRSRGRPVAYITGVKEFWGRDFAVSDAVLVPRPDTELLVDLCLELGDARSRLRDGGLSLHECCAGSGAVAISVAADRPAWKFSASDISLAALDQARSNAGRLLPGTRPGGDIEFLKSDLLEEVDGCFDLILANPPYVETELARQLAALWGEPALALDGGADGLDLIRRLLPEAAARLVPGGWLLVEADPGQSSELRGLFADAGFLHVRTARDLGGLERVTCGERA